MRYQVQKNSWPDLFVYFIVMKSNIYKWYMHKKIKVSFIISIIVIITLLLYSVYNNYYNNYYSNNFYIIIVLN